MLKWLLFDSKLAIWSFNNAPCIKFFATRQIGCHKSHQKSQCDILMVDAGTPLDLIPKA